jgi:hypothetical protein
MHCKLKIPSMLLQEALADLNRPHGFAAERVGFFSTRKSTAADIQIIHCVGYHSVSDVHYIRDNSVGVRIGSGAITEAMSRCAVDHVGQLHVHSHGGRGVPRASATDLAELPAVGRSLWNVNRSSASGWAILSNDSGWASLREERRGERVLEPQVAVIGYPLSVSDAARLTPPRSSLWQRLFARRKLPVDGRYDRQNFLGPNADRIFANVRVGIIGLGGGGSHMAQQLAHLGISHFVLCDYDRITGTNLNRTVGAMLSDVMGKRLKTSIAARGIRGLHPDADIVEIASWQESSDRLLHCDVVVGCVDTFAGRRDLEAFCRRHLLPYVDVGMDVQRLDSEGHEIIGQVIMSMPGRPCMQCIGFLTDKLLAEEARHYGAAGGRPQVVWTNGLVCSAAVGVIVNLLTGWSANRRESVYLNLRGSNVSLREDPRLDYVPNTCAHYPLIEAGDPNWTSL